MPRPYIMRLYHSLPPSFWGLAASMRGYYLRSWRYGAETDRLADEALSRDRWSADQWTRWREERLQQLLHRARTRVPYYSAHWAQRRLRGDRKSWELLENWPLLDKSVVRERPHAFLANDCNPRLMFLEQTSGTTGNALRLWWSRESEIRWYAIYEARLRRWYGVSRHDRWAILGGQLVVTAARRRPPFWVWNAGMNQLYMSSYHLAPDLIPSYIRALAAYRVDFMLGYTSALYALAREVLRQKLERPPLVVIVTNAEPVYGYQRSVIEEAFQCPVREHYGMAEAVAAASECEKGRLHLWPEIGILEDERTGGTAGDTNRVAGDDYSAPLVCTGLLNIDMPLIRYRVGDRARFGGAAVHCACGRSLPLLNGIEGRNDDVLFTADGREVGRLDPVFKASLPIHEAQIIQKAIGSLHVRYVPAGSEVRQIEEQIARELRARMGKVEIVFERVPAVPRESNGKFRAVVNEMTHEERQRANV